jgi:hypothetical protein
MQPTAQAVRKVAENQEAPAGRKSGSHAPSFSAAVSIGYSLTWSTWLPVWALEFTMPWTDCPCASKVKDTKRVGHPRSDLSVPQAWAPTRETQVHIRRWEGHGFSRAAQTSTSIQAPHGRDKISHVPQRRAKISETRLRSRICHEHHCAELPSRHIRRRAASCQQLRRTSR